MTEQVKTREWDAAAYHRLSDPQHGWGLKVLARLSLRGDEAVLDAGCGSGRVTADLAARLPQGRVVALDLSESMVRKAKEFLLPQSSGRARVVCADSAWLPFEECFDGVFSTATFHWVKDHERLFREIYRVLKPGGWLLAQCGGGENLRRLITRARAMMSSAPYARFFEGWTPPQNYAGDKITAERLRAAGFVDVETDLEPAAFSLPTMEIFREYLATVTFRQYIQRISDPQLREEFLTGLAAQAGEDPEFELDYWRLNMRARKPASPAEARSARS